MRTVGTTSRGVRCPVIREGDDLVKIVTDAVLACGEEQAIAFQDKDIVAVTEAVVARSQGNYATTDAIAKDCAAKFGTGGPHLPYPQPQPHCHLPEGHCQSLQKGLYPDELPLG